MPQFKKREGRGPQHKDLMHQGGPPPSPPPPTSGSAAAHRGTWAGGRLWKQRASSREAPGRCQCEKLIPANGLIAPPLRCHKGPSAASGRFSKDSLAGSSDPKSEKQLLGDAARARPWGGMEGEALEAQSLPCSGFHVTCGSQRVSAVVCVCVCWGGTCVHEAQTGVYTGVHTSPQVCVHAHVCMEPGKEIPGNRLLLGSLPRSPHVFLLQDSKRSLSLPSLDTSTRR